MVKNIKQVFVALLSLSNSLTSKFESLSSEPCMARPALTDLDPVKLNHYHPSMTSLDKCSGSCNAVYDLSTKICVPSKTKDVDVKVFDTITRVYEAKTLIKHLLCDCKCKFNRTTCNLNQKWSNDKCYSESKNYRTCKKDYW